MLDTIPVVVRTHTCFDSLYAVFPCLVVNAWTKVTEKLLQSRKQDLQDALRTFKTTYPDIYFNYETILQVLKQT